MTARTRVTPAKTARPAGAKTSRCMTKRGTATEEIAHSTRFCAKSCTDHQVYVFVAAFTRFWSNLLQLAQIENLET